MQNKPTQSLRFGPYLLHSNSVPGSVKCLPDGSEEKPVLLRG